MKFDKQAFKDDVTAVVENANGDLRILNYYERMRYVVDGTEVLFGQFFSFSGTIGYKKAITEFVNESYNVEGISIPKEAYMTLIEANSNLSLTTKTVPIDTYDKSDLITFTPNIVAYTDTSTKSSFFKPELSSEKSKVVGKLDVDAFMRYIKDKYFTNSLIKFDYHASRSYIILNDYYGFMEEIDTLLSTEISARIDSLKNKVSLFDILSAATVDGSIDEESYLVDILKKIGFDYYFNSYQLINVANKYSE